MPDMVFPFRDCDYQEQKIGDERYATQSQEWLAECSTCFKILSASNFMSLINTEQMLVSMLLLPWNMSGHSWFWADPMHVVTHPAWPAAHAARFELQLSSPM
jgi:hypothetical protein